jgi:hypothetical protein
VEFTGLELTAPVEKAVTGRSGGKMDRTLEKSTVGRRCYGKGGRRAAVLGAWWRYAKHFRLYI